MYHIDNKSEPIKEVQHALFMLGYGESHLLPIDGVYKEHTKNAVMHFQQENALLPTGVVDFDTYQLLMLKSVQVEEYALFPLKEGDENERVALLHAYLTLLYSSCDSIPLQGSLFDETTVKYVNMFHNRTGNDENGMITSDQYKRLRREVELLQLTIK